VTLLKRSLEAVKQSFDQADDDALDRHLHFFGEETTVRRVYLRLLAHALEHMGQMIVYLRFNCIAPFWPDWRPTEASRNEPSGRLSPPFVSGLIQLPTVRPSRWESVNFSGNPVTVSHSREVDRLVQNCEPKGGVA
jgi:hypothetical protein